MPDNVAITAGSGTTVSTEEVTTLNGGAVSAQHLQRVATALRTADGTAIDLPGDATNGLDVDVTRLIPGTGATALGKAEDDAHASGDVGVLALGVRRDSVVSGAGTDGDNATLNLDSTGRLWVRPAPSMVRLQVTPTISTSPAYTSGDTLGSQMTFANAARVSGGSGIIQSIIVKDNTQAQRAAMDLVFFDRSITVAADNAAFNVSDADMAYCLGVVSIGPYNTAWPGTPLNSVSTLLNVGLPFVLNGTDLYVVAVVRATPTYGSTSDLTFTLTIQQD